MMRCTAAMISLALAVTIIGSFALSSSSPAQEKVEQRGPVGRFAAIDIFIDSGETALAAYQLEFRAMQGDVKIVGINNGEHAAFSEPPYYDESAMQQERVKIGDFSLNEPKNLPTGRTRITTINLHITGDVEPEFALTLDAAATVDGTPIDAKASFQWKKDEEK